MPRCLLVWDNRTAVFPPPGSLLHSEQWHIVGRSLGEEYAWNAISSFSLQGVSNPTPILFPTTRKSFRKPRWDHPASLFVLGERIVLVLEVIASLLHYFLAQMSSILVFASERVTTKVTGQTGTYGRSNFNPNLKHKPKSNLRFIRERPFAISSFHQKCRSGSLPPPGPPLSGPCVRFVLYT